MAFEKEAAEMKSSAESLLQQGKIKEAEGVFSYLLDRNPHNAELWYFIGTCSLASNHYLKSLILLKQAAELDPEMITAWNNMGVAYKALLQRDEARRCFEKALALYGDAPEYQEYKAQTMANLGGMYSNTGYPERGLEIAEQAYKMCPDDRKVRFNLGLLYLDMGRWAEGFDLYQSREIKDKDYLDGIPVWDGTPGKTVVVYGEQGVGDEIMFASCIPDLARDCRVIFDAHPRLQTMYQRSFQSYIDMAVYGTRKDEHPKWEAGTKIDARLAIGDLGRFYRRKDSDFPRTAYLEPDQDWVERLAERVAPYPGIRIAIAWKGGSPKTYKDKRSMPAKQLVEAVSGLGTIWSLQYTNGAAEECASLPVLHWQDVVDNLEMQAAFVMNMDLVVTVNQSLAHLCGALGKECWVLTPKACAWRYGLSGPRMPFYGDWITQYRQGEDETWEPVLDQLKGDLWKRFQKRIAA